MNNPLLTNLHLYTENQDGNPLDTSVINISPRANTLQLKFAFQLLYVTKNQPLKISVSIDSYGNKLIDSTVDLDLDDRYLDLTNTLNNNQFVASVSYATQAFSINTAGPAFLEIKIRDNEGTILDRMNLPFVIVLRSPDTATVQNTTHGTE